MAQHYRKLRDGSFTILQDGFQIPCTCRNCSVRRYHDVAREIESLQRQDLANQYRETVVLAMRGRSR
jgi:hypothetical protein